MRRLLQLCLLLALAPACCTQGHAQGRALPEPGVPTSLRDELRASMSSDPMDLFRRDLRQPIPEASVEILGTIDPEELKLQAFEEFKFLMLRSLREYLGRYGGAASPRYAMASGPGTRVYPMGKAVVF